MLKFFRTTIIFIISVNFLSGQDASDFELFETIASKKTAKHSYVKSTKVREDQNELQHSIRYLYLIYKNYFSSQDGNQCSFYPSCSDYSLKIMRKDGFIKGGIKTLDRLTRCNSLSPEKYKIDFEKRKLIDHVQ